MRSNNIETATLKLNFGRNRGNAALQGLDLSYQNGKAGPGYLGR